MGEKEKRNKNKKQKHQHPNDQTTKQNSDFSFKPSSEVKGMYLCWAKEYIGVVEE